jgi:Domain of unknown function (DUF222)/HNH endonuclease
MFDAFEDLQAAFDKFAASERPVDLRELRRFADRVEFEWLRRVREHDRAMEWAVEDSASPAAWLRSNVSLAPGEARATIQVARKLDHFPGLAEAFAAGDVSRQHAAVLTTAATPERLEPLQALEPQLVDAAKAMDPRQFRWVVHHACGAIDGDGGVTQDRDQFAKRHFHASPTFEGMVQVDGLLDPEIGETLLTALAACEPAKKDPNDTRTPAQRRADALGDIARHSLVCAEPKQHKGRRRGRPNISVHSDLQMLEARAPEAVSDIRAEAEHVGRLSQATLLRLSCDANISRVITDGRSQVLDIGRSTRTIPPAIWRALVARDRHCRHPGCDRSPGWCEGHHIQHWEHGGPTSLENLMLLCWRHHRAIHEHPPHSPPNSPCG